MELGENIQSYLRWRGDVPFSHAAVNHVDALVLCKLAYFDLSRIAEAAEDQGITLAKCPSLVSDIHPKGPGDAGEGFFDEAASTARFGSVIARCYVDATPYDDDTQFSATEYVLPDGPVFVAFRGTDDTVLGWREDFELGYRRIPAQEKAERYLRDALARAATEGRHVIVGGHSKGANLAQYATTSLTDSELAAGGTSVAFNATIAALLGLSAAFVLVAPQEMLAAYAVTLGITLLVCSVGSFLDWRHDVMERLGE